MAFDFKRHLIKVQGGRTYLPVSARIVWFRQEHPDWTIETEMVELNHEKQYAIFRARISDGDGRLMATGTKKEDVKGFGDYLEKAETGSVGRALALCGFGTQFSPELDETGPGRFADSPQPVGGGRFDGGGGGGSSYGGGGASRYGSPPPGNGNGGGNNGGGNGSPPREMNVSAPPQDRAPAPRAEAPRPKPASAPPPDDGEDDFEALVGGAALLDATEDDPFGDDAPAAKPAAPVRAAAVKADGGGSAVPAGMPACVDCGKALTKSQQELSIRNFGEALCPGCQRDKPRRAVAA